MVSSSPASSAARFQRLLDAANTQLRAGRAAVVPVVRSVWSAAKRAVRRAVAWVLDGLGPIAPLVQTVGGIALAVLRDCADAWRVRVRRRMASPVTPAPTAASDPPCATNAPESVASALSVSPRVAASNLSTSVVAEQVEPSPVSESSSPVVDVTADHPGRSASAAHVAEVAGAAREANAIAFTPRDNRSLAVSLRGLVRALVASERAEPAHLLN